MEINEKEVIPDEGMSYLKAKKKAREIRDFYINLTLFCLIIPIIIVVNLIFVPHFHWFWFSMIGWGTGLVFHGFSTFEFSPFFKKGWEERKTQEFMQEELKREQLKNDLLNQQDDTNRK
ncbi:MAG: 2TM domain-containing protein [Pedobacter sp.]|nr:MAG: 2TM domain-containing protein [Pedobacter sp.]